MWNFCNCDVCSYCRVYEFDDFIRGCLNIIVL